MAIQRKILPNKCKNLCEFLLYNKQKPDARVHRVFEKKIGLYLSKRN